MTHNWRQLGSFRTKCNQAANYVANRVKGFNFSLRVQARKSGKETNKRK